MYTHTFIHIRRSETKRPPFKIFLADILLTLTIFWYSVCVVCDCDIDCGGLARLTIHSSPIQVYTRDML